MEARTKNVLRYAGYGVFGLLSTLFFVYLTFPIEALRGRIAKELEKQYPQARVSFDKASPYRLSGLDIEDLNVTLEGQGDKPSITLRIDRVRARLQILPLLKKQYNIAFDVTLGDGSLSGVVRTSEGGFGLQLDASDVDLGKPPVLAKMLNTTVNGTLGAKLDLSVDFTDPKKSTGGGTLELRKGNLGSVVLTNVIPGMPGSFTLPAVELGSIDLGLEMKDGQLVVKNFTQRSADLEVKISGDVGLRKQLMQSPLNMTVNYKLTEAFTAKDGKLALLAMKKGADGFTKVQLTGSLGAPQPQL